MADEKTVVKGQEEKQNFFTKLINFFKKLPGAIARPFKNMWHELRKVTWPSRPDVIKYSLIVLAFLVFMGVVIALLDAGSTALVKAITPQPEEYKDMIKQQEQVDQLIKQMEEEREAYLATLPNGSYYDEQNGKYVLPDGYAFDVDGSAYTVEELTAKYPEGTTFENQQVNLPEGYSFDVDGKYYTIEELTAKYPEGTLFENGQIILPDGYLFDENKQVIEAQSEENSSEESSETEESVVEDNQNENNAPVEE